MTAPVHILAVRGASGALRVVVFTTLFAVACSSMRGTTAPSPSGAPAVSPRRLVVLGDSLAVYPSADKSFPANLKRRLAKKPVPWTVTNASTSGDTTADGVRNIDDVLSRDVNVLVLSLGANDGLRGVDLATIEQNLGSIIASAQNRGIAVLLCGMETPPTHGLTYSLGFHTLFSRLAQQYRVPLVPFLLSGAVFARNVHGPDGIHPNAAGAQRIADTVWPYLEPLIDDAGEAISAALGSAKWLRFGGVADHTDLGAGPLAGLAIIGPP